jgi:uncharacterized protein involved in exopolysaccharide biosynthesis
MQDQSITALQIRTILYVVKKHKWKIFTLFLSTVITVAVGSLMATPIYRASSRLLVKPGREDVYVSPTGSSPSVIDYSRESEKLNSEIAILKSLSLVINLVDRVGVSRLFDYPDRSLKGKLFKETKKGEIPPVEAAYKAVVGSLEASAVPRSNVIEVAFEWPDPIIAARVVNTLVELYLDHHLKVHTNPQTYYLLEKQAKKWEEGLTNSEKALEAFKTRHSITSLSQQRTILLGRLSEAEAEKRKAEGEIRENSELVASLEAQLSKLEQNVPLQETVNKTSATIAALKAKLVELELQGLKEEINRVKAMIAEEERKDQKVVVSGTSPVRQTLESDLMRARARLEGLKAKQKNQALQIAAYEEELKTLDGFEKQMNELERQVAINEANYKLYLTKFEEAKIGESMDQQKIANVRVIEPAVPILRPVKPKKRLNVMIGGFLGLFAGIGMAFLIEFIHPVFRTREDVDQFLGLPVLATLPKEKLG